MKKMIALGLAASASVILFTGTTAKAEERMTSQQIEQVTQGLKDDQYVLTTPSGGIITNKDGSDNFPPEQVASEGKVMKVADYKKYLATQDISKNQENTSGTAFFGAWIPTRVHVLYPNQEYQSNAFYARGWRYGEERFKPSWGSGNYLYWQAQGDSGLVEDGYGISVVVNDGAYVPVNSRRGTYFKTYNPNTGSRYKVSNPV
ncbi:hypothetical protein [uncultured Streptococcus sp.]|uniref:hypothetical protein n=1 Tax=uncultured Streptococcus sp. TaxID=83427 RepID=UPI00262B1F79|nr:hypothetical protein [uncultured Streptococcus sp.]